MARRRVSQRSADAGCSIERGVDAGRSVDLSSQRLPGDRLARTQRRRDFHMLALQGEHVRELCRPFRAKPEEKTLTTGCAPTAMRSPLHPWLETDAPSELCWPWKHWRLRRFCKSEIVTRIPGQRRLAGQACHPALAQRKARRPVCLCGASVAPVITALSRTESFGGTRRWR